MMAIKRIDLECLADSKIKAIRRRIIDLNNLEHSHLLDYKCSFIDNQYLNLVVELMHGGS